MKKYSLIALVTFTILVFLRIGCQTGEQNEAGQWSVEKAQMWAEGRPWYRGANFNPSTAINQLETWQAETFDPETIDRELGWAAAIGFN